MGNRLGDPVWMRRLGQSLGQGSGKIPITFLLRDNFPLDASPPVTSPRTCLPGPGQLTLTDTGNKVSISNSILVAGTATNTRDPWLRNVTGFNRVAGRALIARIARSSIGANQVTPCIGWGNTLTAPDYTSVSGFLFNGGVGDGLDSPSLANLPTADILADDSYMGLAIVLRTTGWFLITGVDSTPVLSWVGLTDSAATMYPMLFSRAGVGVKGFNLDYFWVRDLAGLFATDNGIATLNVTGVSGTVYTADANGIYDLAFTLPAGSANLVAAELRFRRQDATNYWSFYVKRNAGNTAWDVYLDKVTAGTPATQAGYPATGVGTVDLLRVIADGNRINCYSKVTTTITKRGGEIADATFQTQASVVPIAGAGTTLGTFLGWARRASEYGRVKWF